MKAARCRVRVPGERTTGEVLYSLTLPRRARRSRGFWWCVPVPAIVADLLKIVGSPWRARSAVVLAAASAPWCAAARPASRVHQFLPRADRELRATGIRARMASLLQLLVRVLVLVLNIGGGGVLGGGHRLFVIGLGSHL